MDASQIKLPMVVIRGASGNTAEVDINGNLLVNPTSGGGGGTVAQGSPNTPANSWPVEITDGVNILGTAAYPLKTDGSGVTQPVSISSLPLPTNAAQDGTDGTGITPPTGGVGIRGWLSGIYKALIGTLTVAVNNFPSTQAISAASLPLPSGAATAAKQPALGTAGTPSTDVISIQGIASMTSVKVDGSGVTQPVSGSVSVSNFPATQPVSGSLSISNFPSTQAVSGSVSVSNFPSTQPVSGSVSVSNFPSTQAITAASLPLPSGAAQDGTDGTGISQPTGGAGIRGWLSGIYKAVTGTLTATVTGTVGVNNFPATQPISAAALPLPSGAAQDGTDGTGITPPTGGAGIRGWLSGIYKAITGTLTVAVNNFPSTQTVSGSVSVSNFPSTQAITAAQLPGALDTNGFLKVHEQGTANVSVQNSSIAITAASLPLPTGAATSAKQPALGTAGSPASDVISVQGIASMTALKVDGSGVTQPVSGSVSVSNFPATQAVSGTVTSNQGGAPWTTQIVDGTTTTQKASVSSAGAVKVDGSAVTQPVSGSVSVSNFPSTQTVSGAVSVSNFPATQAVSGTVTSNQGGAPWTTQIVDGTTTTQKAAVSSAGAVKVDGSAVTQPISGSVSVSNFPATQTVSGTVTSNQGSAPWTMQLVDGTTTTQKAAVSSAGAVKVDGSAVTQPVSIAASVTVAQATASNLNATVSQATAANLNATVSQATAANLNVTATPIAITKGTQGTTGFTTQDLKDSGRNQVTLFLDAVAGVTTEALATMSITKGLVAQTAATSYTVTSGKTLRIQSITVTVTATSTTALTSAKVRLRGAASSFSVSSPVLATLAITPPTAAAAAGASATTTLVIPDGLEIPSTNIIGISQVVSSTSSAVTVTVVGYEY